MRVWTSEPSLWVILFLVYAGVSGQSFNVTIMAIPDMTSYSVGNNLTLTCVVDPMPLANSSVMYAWNCTGCFANEMNSSMITQVLTDMDTSMINCSATIDGTPYRSGVFDLQVTQAEANVTVNPNLVQGAMVGNPQTIECRVGTVPGVTIVSINWTGPNVVTITNSSRMSISPTISNGSVFTSNLRFEYLMEGDEGNYTCSYIILESNGSISAEIQPLIIPPPNVSVTALNDTQTVGQSLTLQCEVTAVRGITSRVDIVWSSNGTELQRMNNVSSTMMSDSLVYTNSYTILQLSTANDSRVIQCQVVINVNPEVEANDSYTIDVNVPTPMLTISPSGPIQGAMVGSPQVISCTVSTVSGVESSLVMVSWMGPGGNITNDSRVTISQTTFSGNNYTRNLEFEYLAEGDEGNYSCNVMIPDSSESQSVEIQSLTVPTPTVSVTAPSNQTVGQSLTLQCEVTTVRGITSGVEIVWSSGGTERQRMNIMPSTMMNNLLVYTNFYNISQLSTTDNGTVIQCEAAVINASPPVMASDSITLDVTVAVEKPEVHQSVRYPDEGSSHNLTCIFTLPAGVSRNHLKIDWIRNGSVMTNSSRVMISGIMKTGAQESQEYAKTVTFQNVQSSTDNGTYNCTVNIIGFENFDTITVNVTVIVINDDDDSSSVAGAVVGGVLGALFILVIIIMIMLFYVFWYRRKEPKSYDVETPTRTRKRTTSNHSLSSKNSLIGGKNGNVVPSSPSDIPMAPLEDGVKKRMTPIPLENFSNYVQEMHKDRDLGFEAEYSTISDEAVFTFNAAKTAANNPKNRYVNINPYDYSRVKLLGVTGKGKDTDYINASYIDGFQKPDAYIAAQGPLPDTVKDFWQMIWDHKLQTIVMLTKPVEAGTVKCEVYWPEKVNETLNLKPTLQVRTTYMQYFADFDMRSFEVSNPSEPSDIALQVTHFYFTSWPDHGVPQFATALISFIKKVRKHYSSDGPPMVVHCSAGVGRSGTFITLDTMLQRMPHTNNVNVYEFVHNMRKKRVFMVQTLAQYIFVHDALEELITCGDTSFNAQDMISRVARLSDVIPGKEVTGFEEQFNLLQKVSRQFNEGDCSDALSQHNISKNRSDKAVPYNVSRVQMKATPLPGSDYINASFVDGYKHRNAFIVTQCPMENTVNDFWRMMWESQSAVIVMLCSEQHDPEDFYKYWPDEEAEYGKIKVTTKSKVDRSSYTGYKFAVLGESVKMTPLQVTLLHYTQWAPLQAPVNTKALLGVTKELLEIQRHTGNKAITVMCSDGCGRSGSFITIYYTLERVKAEQTVDIFQAIKNSRIRRTGLVSNAEQYKQCHQAITEFLDEFSAYANFI